MHIGIPLTGDMTESIWDYTIVSTLLKLYSKFLYIFSSVTVFFIQCEELDIKNHILRGFFHLELKQRPHSIRTRKSDDFIKKTENQNESQNITELIILNALNIV